MTPGQPCSLAWHSRDCQLSFCSHVSQRHHAFAVRFENLPTTGDLGVVDHGDQRATARSVRTRTQVFTRTSSQRRDGGYG